MSFRHEDLESSWGRTTTHLNAARSALTSVDGVDLSWVDEFLDHNELGLAFDTLVDLGDELDLPIPYWQTLDQAAREMQLYTVGSAAPHAPAAATCRRHLAAR